MTMPFYKIVLGTAILAMSNLAAVAQTNTIKPAYEKLRLYRYDSYWVFPRAHWGDVDKDNAAGNQKILAPALAEGTLVGYGDAVNLMHSAEGFTHANWWQANSWAGVMKVVEGFHKGGGSSSPLLVSATKHWDQVFVSRFYNWKAGSWKGAYRYTATYELKPEWPDPNAAIQTLSTFDVPLFEKLLADGTIVEYEIDRELIRKTDSPAKFVYLVVTPSAEALDKMTAVVRAAVSEKPLLGPVFASMTVNQTPQIDILQVNATYK
ncbi:MAG TPA: hypothetical protein VIX84_17160 [Acidimicrobiales bacterium]